MLAGVGVSTRSLLWTINPRGTTSPHVVTKKKAYR